MLTAKNLNPELKLKSVDDTDISKLLNLRESKSFLKKRLEQIDSDIEAIEKDLIERIDLGAQIICRYPVSVKVTERRYPSWKEEFIKLAGEQKAKNITELTPPTVSKSIVVLTK